MKLKFVDKIEGGPKRAVSLRLRLGIHGEHDIAVMCGNDNIYDAGAALKKKLDELNAEAAEKHGLPEDNYQKISPGIAAKAKKAMEDLRFADRAVRSPSGLSELVDPDCRAWRFSVPPDRRNQNDPKTGRETGSYISGPRAGSQYNIDVVLDTVIVDDFEIARQLELKNWELRAQSGTIVDNSEAVSGGVKKTAVDLAYELEQSQGKVKDLEAELEEARAQNGPLTAKIKDLEKFEKEKLRLEKQLAQAKEEIDKWKKGNAK